MIFRHFLTSVNESNAFLLACEETNEALLVDAGAFEPEISEFIRSHGLLLKKLFVTHDHYDHTGGVNEIVDKYGAEVLAGKGNCGGRHARVVRHGDTVRVGELIGHVLATPGHTPEGISLHIDGMVFTGDALFSGSVGGTGSETQAEQQRDAIRRHIFTLPPETEIHTGHGPSSTVAVESRYNPFFM